MNFIKYFSSSKIIKQEITNETLDEIVNLLFPVPKILVDKDGKRVMIDYSLDMNLESVLQDLSVGEADASTIKTLRLSIEKLKEIRYLTNKSLLPDDFSDISYIVVDDGSDPEEFENIEIKEI